MIGISTDTHRQEWALLAVGKHFHNFRNLIACFAPFFPERAAANAATLPFAADPAMLFANSSQSAIGARSESLQLLLTSPLGGDNGQLDVHLRFHRVVLDLELLAIVGGRWAGSF